MFGNLPAHEKQAFFGLLDEYFTARPHLLGSQDGEAEEIMPTSYTYAQPASPPAPTTAAAPAPAPRRSNPPLPATRKPASVPSPPVRGPIIPAGLSSGKSIGSIKTSSAGAAFGSMIKSNNNSKNPVTPGEAISGLHAMTTAANRMNLSQQQQQGRGPPPPPPAAAAPASLGQAEVLYEYKGTDAEDLTVRRFEIIDLIEKVNDDWWKAEATDGSARSGLVPAAYVKVL